MRPVPYIGITDFTSADQAAAMRRILDEVGSKHLLHVGVMMSYETLRGYDTKWAKVFPPKESLRGIFVERSGVLNVLHYADYKNLTTVDDLLEAIYWAGPAVDAIQLDMVWPDLKMLEALRDTLGESERTIKFIIQINEKAIEKAGHLPGKVVDRLLEYSNLNCLDYALFDMSCGKGVPMKPHRLLSYIWDAVSEIPDLGVAAAGGLGPKTLHHLEPVVWELSRSRISVSQDAQRRLHRRGNIGKPIHWGMAAKYVRRSAIMHLKYQSVLD